MKEKVIKIIADHLKIDESTVSLDSQIIEDLGADSLHIVELVMEIENNFDITIPDDDAEGLTTVGKVVEYVEDYACLLYTSPSPRD